ncbi:hypothetical protein BDY19DRAFT_941886 [Irpex rosettiformis]|uniref:Uncharacterized protein n=1 Tax=Irpex rosettiformis TaxID=378272 RepID=A0ACB8U6T5_9APHY|nr:hypothetical protein BDY19DRAFT_941886 [Irpex rosettiformis]
MTRSTRSTATQQQQNEKEKPLSDTPKKTVGAKKRKRTSVADPAEQPANKVVRTQDGVKEEGSPEPVDEQKGETVTAVDLPSSGDVPLTPADAEQILDVLEMIDTQGLLDRIFPLPTGHTLTSESEAGPSTSTQSYSFRALLKSPSSFPLRVLRTAVKHLFPISSHPRSRPSAPAAEQIRFCQLALSLLDQASLHQAPISLDLPSLIPPSRSPEGLSSNSVVPRSQRKYALVQHLPTGDWWSSLNSTTSALPDGKDMKDLPTAYAELVAILPSASTSEPPADSLTLGQYIKKRTFKPQHVPQQRVIPCGSFLDYGPYAAFAPTFEQNGVEVGRERLSEVIWFKEQDKRRRERLRAYREQLAAKAAQTSSAEPPAEESDKTSLKQKEKLKEEDVRELEGLLTPEQISNIKAALGSLELESSVSELLERNRHALARLEDLQLQRLSEGPKDVEVGSEEWETAQNILESLTLLASLRPRSSADGDSAPLIPPASTLRKLHRSLPVGITQGWYGTLSDGRQVACSDDNTIRIRTGVPAPSPTSPPPSVLPAVTPTPAPSAPAPSKPATTSYSTYSYSSSYATPYRGGYYPNYQTSAASTTGTNHYPNHQYTTSGQQPYAAYSSWYNYQPQSATPTSGSATPVAKSSGYGGYFSNTQQPTPQRAVANTVLNSSGTAGRTWANGSAYIAPTIPPHMRNGGGGSASIPGTPQPTGAGGYYIGIQQQPQAAATSQL